MAMLGLAALTTPEANALGAASDQAVPVSASPPRISGSAVEGQTLSESHAAWSNSPTSYSYQWEDCDGYGRNCASISGATAQTYTLTAHDLRHTVRVLERATNAAGTSGAVASAPTSIVSPPGHSRQPPWNAGRPLLDGAAYVGGRLQASTGAWAGTVPFSYSYQWQRCRGRCATIAGATRPAYTLVGADFGARIRVVVRASNRAGVGRAVSSPTAPAGPSDASIRSPLAKALTPSGRAGRASRIRSSRGYVAVFTTPLPGRLNLEWYYLPKGAHLGQTAVKGKPQPVLVAEAFTAVKRAGKVRVKLRLSADGLRLLRGGSARHLTGEGTFAPAGRPVVVARVTFALVR
jgi:hypothetical protein